MAFRDDGDAARARADALQRELEQTKQKLEASDDESEQLRNKLEAAEAEAKKHKKRADKLAGKVEGKSPTVAIAIAAAVALVVAGLFVAGISTSDMKKRPGPRASPARSSSAPVSGKGPQASYIERNAKFYWLRLCLDNTDQQLHSLWKAYRHGTAAEVRAIDKWHWRGWHNAESLRCRDLLAGLESRAPALPDVDAILPRYRAAIVAWLPLAIRMHRYYDQEDFRDDDYKLGAAQFDIIKRQLSGLVAASRELRRALAAPYAEFVKRDITHAATRRTRTSALAAPIWHAAHRFFDALVADETALAELTRHLNAIIARREELARLELQHSHALRYGSEIDRLIKALKNYIRDLRDPARKANHLPYSRRGLAHRYHMANGAYISSYLIPEGWYSYVRMRK